MGLVSVHPEQFWSTGNNSWTVCLIWLSNVSNKHLDKQDPMVPITQVSKCSLLTYIVASSVTSAIGGFGASGEFGAFGSFGAFRAFGSLRAFGAIVAFYVFGAFGAFWVFGAFGAFGTFQAFGEIGAFGAFGVFGVFGAIGALGVFATFGPFGGFWVLKALLTIPLNLSLYTSMSNSLE